MTSSSAVHVGPRRQAEVGRNLDVTVLATGAFLPGDPLDNSRLEAIAGPIPADILAGIQVQRRHWMIEPTTGQHHYSISEMATRAVRQALDRAGVAAAEVDLLVLSTASPEYPLPATVTSVQAALGIARAATLELRSGCAGAVQAMDIGRRLLESGAYRTAVVIGAEAISPLLAPIYLNRRPDDIRLRDRMNIYTFGDGAGAAVLRASTVNESPSAKCFLGSFNACFGGDRPPGMQIIGAGTDAPIADQLRRSRLVDLKVDLKQSAEFGPTVFLSALDELLVNSGLSIDDIDACVLPEGNAEYFSGDMETHGISAQQWRRLQPKIVENLTDVGATGSAAVPLALDSAACAGRLRAGDRVALLGIEASRWIAAGLVMTWPGECAIPLPAKGI